MIEIYLKRIDLGENKIESQNKAKEALFEYVHINSNDIYKNASLKPYLRNSNIFFNISHSGSYLALSKSDKEVGIDIERVKEVNNPLRFTKVTFSINDNNEFKNPSSKEILMVHTIKESYLKFLGIGLVKDLNNVIIDYKNKTVKYKDYKVGYYNTTSIYDILLTVTSESDFDYSINEV